MHGLVVMEVMTPSGHLSNIDEMAFVGRAFCFQSQIVPSKFFFHTSIPSLRNFDR